MITGLQTLRVIALAATFSFPILILPSSFVASGTMFRLSAQLPWIALMLLTTVGAGLASRWVELRDPSGGSAQQVAIAYRNRFFLQAMIGMTPGALAFVFSLIVRPFPGIAVLLGIAFTVLLVGLVAPTQRTLDRLQDQARGQGVTGDVRDALDELYTWRP